MSQNINPIILGCPRSGFSDLGTTNLDQQAFLISDLGGVRLQHPQQNVGIDQNCHL